MDSGEDFGTINIILIIILLFVENNYDIYWNDNTGIII